MGNSSCLAEVSRNDLEPVGVKPIIDCSQLAAAQLAGPCISSSSSSKIAEPAEDGIIGKDITSLAKGASSCLVNGAETAACRGTCEGTAEAASGRHSTPASAASIPSSPAIEVAADQRTSVQSGDAKAKTKKGNSRSQAKRMSKPKSKSGLELIDTLAEVSRGQLEPGGDKLEVQEKVLADMKEHREKTRKINERMAKVMEEAKGQADPMMGGLKEQLLFGFGTTLAGMDGRAEALKIAKYHYVLNGPMEGPWPEHCKVMVFANGCFWGSEKGAWRLPGVYSTATGYAAGSTKNPYYHEVCSGRTGAAEAVQVVYDPAIISLVDILRWFWESHDPTQGNGQGGDKGTQYRSGLYYFDAEQQQLMRKSMATYGQALRKAGKGEGPLVTTEIKPASSFSVQPGKLFYYAEDEHQQYLAKPNARQYCGAEPQGVSLPPFSEWAPVGLEEAHRPKLPEAFWREHAPRPGCVLRAPDAQLKWPPADK